MSEVNRWKEQYDIIGSPYEWNLFISFHGRMIDDDGDIVELQEITSMQEPSHVEPTSEQYAAMSDIKRRLTQQTILIRHDASKIRRHSFFTWNHEEQKTVPHYGVTKTSLKTDSNNHIRSVYRSDSAQRVFSYFRLGLKISLYFIHMEFKDWFKTPIKRKRNLRTYFPPSINTNSYTNFLGDSNSRPQRRYLYYLIDTLVALCWN
jgi:hypothetical protein